MATTDEEWKMSGSGGSAKAGGLGFVGALFLTFFVLKMTGVINWSWVWVTAPLWVTGVAVAVLLIFVLGIVIWANR